MGEKKIFKEFSYELTKVEEALRRSLDSSVPLMREIGDYVLSSGGKRIRPLLLIASERIFQDYTSKEAITLGVVLEFIHTASLLHDDVVDHANTRRGKRSANSIWGNEASVLLGDFLYTKSLSIIVTLGSLEIVGIISHVVSSLAEGEMLEIMHSFDIGLDEERYIEIITKKTALLFCAAAELGAIVGKAADSERKILYDYGLNLGISFQIVDDILDYIGDEKIFGKKIGKDILEGKATLPLIYAYSKVGDGKKKEFLRVFSKKEISEDEKLWVIEEVKKAGGIDYSFKLAKEYKKKAKESLLKLPSRKGVPFLLEFADFMVERVL